MTGIRGLFGQVIMRVYDCIFEERYLDEEGRQLWNARRNRYDEK